MNNKALLLTASVLAATSVLGYGDIAFSKTVSNGAIVDQLVKDNTMELSDIQYGLSGEENRFEKQVALIKYYENRFEYEKSDECFYKLIELMSNYYNDDRDYKIEQYGEIVKKSVLMHPNSARDAYKLSVWEKNFGSFEEACKYAGIAVSIDKANPLYLYEYASLLLDQNEYIKAIKIYENLKKHYPRNVDYRLALARAYTQAGLYDNAVKEYRIATGFDPDNENTVIALHDVMNLKMIARNTSSEVKAYDPMTNVKPSKVRGEKVVAFNASEKPQVNVKPAVAKTNQSGYEFAQPQEPRRQLENPDASAKRLLVTYVNGRKVVKIVKIDTNTNSAFQDVSRNFDDRLIDSNAGSFNSAAVKQRSYSSDNIDYEYATPGYWVEKKNNVSLNNFKKEVNYVESSAEDYSYSEIKPTNIANATDRKQMVVTYKNGKRVIQNVTPGQSALSEISQYNDEQITSEPDEDIFEQKSEKVKEDKKIKEDKKAKKVKKANNKNKSSENTQPTADETDLYIKVNELLSQNQFQEVIDLLEPMDNLSLRSITAIAASYNSLGNVDKSIEYYQKADNIAPNNTQILYSLAYLYYSKNDVPSARKYVDKALECDPNNPNAQELAKHLVQQASNVVINKVVPMMNKKEYNQARKILENHIMDYPNDFQAFYHLGHIDLATQKNEDAINDFSKAVQLNPYYALSYYSLGLAYDKVKDYKRALDTYEQFLKMETDDNKYTQYVNTRIKTINSKK